MSGRKITPAERAELDAEIAEHSRTTEQINQRGEIEARRAGNPGGAVRVRRGWVVHPDDRGRGK